MKLTDPQLLELEKRAKKKVAAATDLELIGVKPSTILSLIIEIRELRSARAPDTGWRPIETAPIDGTEILGWNEDAGRVICHWGKHNHVPLYSWIRRIELYGEEVDGFDPVLWQPLPTPPSEQMNQEGGDNG